MLTFRMYADIKLNKPIDGDKDFVSTGSYCMTMKGKEVQFDFEEYVGEIDEENPCILHVMCKNPDYACFEDLENITKDMLENVEDISEFMVYSGEPGESDLEPVSIEKLAFILPYEDGDEWISINVKKEVLQRARF